MTALVWLCIVAVVIALIVVVCACLVAAPIALVRHLKARTRR